MNKLIKLDSGSYINVGKIIAIDDELYNHDPKYKYAAHLDGYKISVYYLTEQDVERIFLLVGT